MFQRTKIRKHIPKYLKTIWTNISSKDSKKNITEEDPTSAYYQSCAAKFLQAFARMDRGKKKSENIITLKTHRNLKVR